MKNAFIMGLIIAVSIAVVSLIYFIHPVLVLTLKDVLGLILFDVGVAFCLALYLGYEKSQNIIILWTIIGSACLLIPIVASLIKYNREKNKK
jgi:hypothetical protein